MKLLSLLKSKKKYVLVISWWGTRGFYALGIIKWLEELGFRDKIHAIYGVSAGAILASYRAAGYSAEQIYHIFYDTKPFTMFSLNLFSKKSIMKADFFEKQFSRDLPANIKDLTLKTYIWTTDTNTGKFILFDSWKLVPILLGSMAIPGVFPAVPYEHHILIDGGTTNNFPIELAKKRYPEYETIGISLNKFLENQKIATLIDVLSVSFEILLRRDTIEHKTLADHLFYERLSIKVLDINKKNMRTAYLQGYESCMRHFKK